MMTPKAYGLLALLVVLLLLTMCGCGGQVPPRHYSLDSSFNEAERETVRAAVQEWCDAAAWCPMEALFSEDAHFQMVDSLGRSVSTGGEEGKVAGKNMGDGRILIARDRPGDLDTLFIVAAHEIGHLCTEHTSSGLMADFHVPGEGETVDEIAVAAWHAGCP
jgi:hypothetical protein